MNILLTGATGYIGKRLLPVLFDSGHHVVCCVRDATRFDISAYPDDRVKLVEVDFLDGNSLGNIPGQIDIAYYLIHSMSASMGDFEELEKESARNFVSAINQTNTRQVIYLGGIVNDQKLSKHLSSRKNVEEILSGGNFGLTTLRAGIILGSGSASFEIIRDLVEKLPVMIAPKWLNTKSQPIAIHNIIDFLHGVIGLESTFGKSIDVGGPEVLTYKEMLLRFAKVRGLKRKIMIVPVMTPRLSSFWLYFVTSTSYKLAVNLVNSMKVEVIARKNDLAEKLDISLLSYEQAVITAFDKIEQQQVISSWTDSLSSKTLQPGISSYIEIPMYGCFTDKRVKEINNEDKTMQKIWTIGGKNGWYHGNWLWALRGFLDKLVGGVGLRRGRRSQESIYPGDALDFWRVLYASKKEKRLLLYAEMKLPGEAWLEFAIKNGLLYQTATFRPKGVWGRFYWFAVWPFHGFIFNGLIKKLVK